MRFYILHNCLCHANLIQEPEDSSIEQRLLYTEFIKALRFPHIFSRRDAIKDPHTKSCRWILQDPRFTDWVDPQKHPDHHGFLWIAGKAGAGKSTLMKFMSRAEPSSSRKDHLSATFFFHARGHALEKSISGMYRSLLVQLLEGLKEPQSVIDDSNIVLDEEGNCPSNEVLKGVLKQGILKLGTQPLTCFIDALDEGDEQQIIEMVRYFEELAEEATQGGIRFRICFSSRHYPYIDIRHGIRLTLEDQAGHTEDLVNYVKSHLRVNSPAPVADFHGELLRRSSGVFLWVVLVVDILNKESRRGGFSLLSRLKEIPSDLRDLFADMLTRDREDMHGFRLCINLILFSKRPLTPAEFYHALWSGLRAKGLADENPPDSSSMLFDSGALSSVINSSKGLAEITRSSYPVVQFIHESVRDFLLKDNGLATIWPDFATFASHEVLRDICTFYIEKIDGYERGALSWAGRKYPFLGYSHQHALDHSEAAAESLSQDGFLLSFPIEKWIRAQISIPQPNRYHQHEPSARLIYVLAERALPRLIQTRIRQRAETVGEGIERFRYPFFAALVSRSRAALAAILELPLNTLMDMLQPTPLTGSDVEGRTPLTWAVSCGLVDLCAHLIKQGANPTERDRRHLLPLRMAIQSRKTAIITLLLKREEPAGSHCPRNDPVPTGARGEETISYVTALLGLEPWEAREPLCLRAALEDPQVARLLYEAGASLSVRDAHGNTPLGLAAINDFRDTLEALIEAGADINNDRDDKGRTPLFHAVVNEHATTAEFLLRSGARIHDQGKFQTALNTRDASGNTPLHRAIRSGHQVLARLLVDFGADPSTCLRNGSWPMHFGTDVNVASTNGSWPRHLEWINDQASILKYLSLHGADVNAGNSDGATSLHMAAKRGLLETTERLLEHEDVNSTDPSGFTPLHTAFTGSSEYSDAVVRLLLEHGADIEARTTLGLTPLHLCVSNPFGQAQRLIDHGAEIDSRDNQGLTPLYFACRAAWSWNMDLLCRHGADANARNSEGSTLLHLACNEDHEGTVVRLIAVGADVNAQNHRGSTPLHVAAQNGKEGAARALILHGADVNSRDIEGRTPVDVADVSIVHVF